MRRLTVLFIVMLLGMQVYAQEQTPLAYDSLSNFPDTISAIHSVFGQDYRFLFVDRNSGFWRENSDGMEFVDACLYAGKTMRLMGEKNGFLIFQLSDSGDRLLYPADLSSVCENFLCEGYLLRMRNLLVGRLLLLRSVPLRGSFYNPDTHRRYPMTNLTEETSLWRCLDVVVDMCRPQQLGIWKPVDRVALLLENDKCGRKLFFCCFTGLFGGGNTSLSPFSLADDLYGVTYSSM